MAVDRGCDEHPRALLLRPRWSRERCLECWACVAVCPEGVRSFDESGAVFDEGRCTGCGSCVSACPAGALELVPCPPGRPRSV